MKFSVHQVHLSSWLDSSSLRCEMPYFRSLWATQSFASWYPAPRDHIVSLGCGPHSFKAKSLRNVKEIWVAIKAMGKKPWLNHAISTYHGHSRTSGAPDESCLMRYRPFPTFKQHYQFPRVELQAVWPCSHHHDEQWPNSRIGMAAIPIDGYPQLFPVEAMPKPRPKPPRATRWFPHCLGSDAPKSKCDLRCCCITCNVALPTSHGAKSLSLSLSFSLLLYFL